MSTRSGIGIEQEDGTVVGVYCHSDGYPAGVGKTLQEHYREPPKLSSLVALGDISSLDQDIGDKHPFNKRPEGWTTFYGRDRGETGTAPRTFANRDEFRAGLRRAGAEYLYLSTTADSGYETRWEVSKPWGRWRSLEDVLERGADVLVEHHPDEGPDILVDHRNGHAGTAILRAGSRVGRGWLSETVDKDFADAVDGVAVTPDLLRGFEEHARHDGLVVDHDNGPARLQPVGSDAADIVVERHFLFGSPVLAVRFQTPTALEWGKRKRNRRPDVPGGREDVWLCHPKALPAIKKASREGLVVVVAEGEPK